MSRKERKEIIKILAYALVIQICVFLFSSPALMVSCKPAVYLYPEKAEKVNITLAKSIVVDTNMPKFVPDKGWNVLAHPDGHIKDLQPEYTDCKKIESNKFGLEYAKKACETNNYPYIYWDGINLLKQAPKKKEGWVVKSSEMQRFLEKKLDYVGFNRSEKTEFLNYWVPKLSKGEFYFIYFVQDEEVDSYLPMQVKPVPDSSNRFYIIAKKLKKKPGTLPKPQTLVKFARKGFTLVDWGGSVL